MLATHSPIAYRTGTYRAAGPERTWARVSPLLPRFGISRVADITRLDEIGLPVHVAYRPVGTTLAVSVGTGLTDAQARVGAVMESIELWHAENLTLTTVARDSAAALRLPYPVTALNLAERSPLTDRVVLDWVAGRGVLSGAERLVPYDTIAMDFTGRYRWAHALFLPSSNGLASGASAADASLHAMLELIERDCVTGLTRTPRDRLRYVDPATCDHPDTATVYRALREADCRVEVCDITNRIGVPCFSARIWSPDVPMVCGGFGCHVDPAIALGRAMAEAAQSRLTTISGARDDIAAEAYRPRDPSRCPLRDGGGPVAARTPAVGPDEAGDLTGVLRYCARRVAAATGVEPFVVDLTRADIGVPVSKVFAPGLELHDERALRSARDDGDD